MRWVSSWAGCRLEVPSVSAPSPVPAFLVDRIHFGLKVGVPIISLGFLPATGDGLFMFSIINAVSHS